MQIPPEGPELNFADLWESYAEVIGTQAALIHGEEVRTWAEFESRADRLAGAMGDAGVGPGSTVALYLHNCPEYLEATFAAFKLRAAPVNVNYRYREEELHYLLDNCSAEVLVHSAELGDRVAHVWERLSNLKLVLSVGPSPSPPVAPPAGVRADTFDGAVEGGGGTPGVTSRSPDDLWLLYTGGTTGMPKGVMWPHRSLNGIFAGTWRYFGEEPPATVEGAVAAVGRIHASATPQRLLAAAPLMHGTAGQLSLGALTVGGAVATLPSRSLDAAELWDLVEEQAMTHLAIVGDAFARPLIAELRNTPERDLSSLKVIYSSGLMFSAPLKENLLELIDVTLVDLLGSSEGSGFGSSVVRRNREAGTGRFRLGEHAAVFTEDGRRVEPGSGEVGVLAVGGPIPVGYFRDPEKTAATYRIIEGRRWAVPGDFATVEADGSVRLLGRGSVSINTGGEKVYPEEVEEAVKGHPAVSDCNVVGVPDDRWGEAVTAVVSLQGTSVPGADLEGEIIDAVKSRLAPYKAPKSVVFVAEIRRSPNGKSDYAWARSVAVAAAGG